MLTAPSAPPSAKKRKQPPVSDEAKQLVGRRGHVKLEGFEIPVKILDVRNRYGNVDALVRPEGGAGERWIKMTRVVLWK